MSASSSNTGDLTGRRILVGVTGGIAAYKTAFLVSRLVQSGAQVRVAMTRAAHKFIGSATFEALTGRPVVSRGVNVSAHPLGPHIELARESELLVVAPCTANFLAKTALGLADDLLSTLYLCFTGKVLFAPAMNNEMWAKPSVQRNVATLAGDGVHFVGPGTGWLSCRETGQGRMSDPEIILQAICELLK